MSVKLTNAAERPFSSLVKIMDHGKIMVHKKRNIKFRSVTGCELFSCVGLTCFMLTCMLLVREMQHIDNLTINNLM